jgi:pantoate--beta-alanine ligase
MYSTSLRKTQAPFKSNKLRMDGRGIIEHTDTSAQLMINIETLAGAFSDTATDWIGPMPHQLRTFHTLPNLRAAVRHLRKNGQSIALVPTMGALHGGHLSLVRLARRRMRRVIVSIFVNPSQFAPNEDFASYPRSFETDLAALSGAGVDIVWAPSVELMYPKAFATRLIPEGPAKAGLEDAFRSHFFSGVATVVCKLLIQCSPDVAIFGEKDFQQLKVVTRLAADLDLPVKILGAPTIREQDGLAKSSRNAYLSPPERAAAPVLFRVLTACAVRIEQNEAVAPVLDAGAIEIERHGFRLDYLELRHAETLEKVTGIEEGPLRLLVAARIGRTRLIDNVPVATIASR